MSDLIVDIVNLRYDREPDYSDHERDIIKGVKELQATITEQQAHINQLTNEKLALQYKLIKEKT
jgi:hypothetical protein